jgi:hypothetical protein
MSGSIGAALNTVNQVLDTAGRAAYQLGFQISPIIFTGGIAQFANGYLPIISITENNDTLLRGLDDFFAHFQVVPGGKLANYSVGQYPFANQYVAANAIIAEPLSISLRMSIPVNKPGGHAAKLSTMLMLQAAIQKHANLGGTYTIVTPAGLYTNCILTNWSDVSSGDSAIPQNTYQWDFIQPLVTLEAAEAAMNTFMAGNAAGLPTNGTLNATANSPAIPSTAATGIAGLNPTSAQPLTDFAGGASP